MNTKFSKIKFRITWGFNPVTRVKNSKKIYSRKKSKKFLITNIKFNQLDKIWQLISRLFHNQFFRGS